MKIRFLGYASNSFSSVKTVSFLLYKDEEIMLVDCGPSITNNLHALVENFSDITSVYISHSHFDHFLGLPYFIIGRHLDVIAKKKKNPDYTPSALDIYLPASLIEITHNLIQICHKDIAKLSYDVNYYPINEGAYIDFAGTSICPFAVNHTVETYGFSVFYEGKKLLSYTSDTLYDSRILDKLSDSKYLILEGMVPESENAFSVKSMHATFDQAKSVVQHVKPKEAFLVHLQPRYLSAQKQIIEELNVSTDALLLFPDEDVDYVLCI